MGLNPTWGTEVCPHFSVFVFSCIGRGKYPFKEGEGGGVERIVVWWWWW
jgi:hypothetical protein